MTVTDTDKAQLIQALLEDPDFLDTLRTTARARAERPFFNMAGERIGINPLTATGRVQVSPGQTISSASWGNPVWDQSINVFADAPSRDSQWPSPHDGSECYTLDTSSPWVYRAGAWHGRPKGYVASGSGPASSTGYTTTANVVSLAVPVVLGRRYRLTGYFSGATGASGATVRVGIVDDQAGTTWIWYDSPGTAASTNRSGSAAALYTPSATKTATLVVQYAGGPTFTIGANNANLFVEDIGG